MKVRVVSVTPRAEETMAYCARVSSPNQENSDFEKLFKYCYRNGHWSVFEMANLTVEVETSRAIAQQLLRHRSFSFQEFSQRYSPAGQNTERLFEDVECRLQDKKNRQSSLEISDEDMQAWFQKKTQAVLDLAESTYNEFLSLGVAKETARFILPATTATKLYVNGTIRSHIHYLISRLYPGTQKEHREMAKEWFRLFSQELPVLGRCVMDELRLKYPGVDLGI